MYSIKDLSVMTGLTERTLRNYLKMGLLTGEKQDGVWRFNEAQLEAFWENDYVKASLKANRSAILFDYLRATPEKENSACMILHLPKENAKEVAAFFCDAVCKRQGLKMTFDGNKGANRVILIGDEETVYDVMREYHGKKADCQ